MNVQQLCAWVMLRPHRQQVIMTIPQPLTTRQWAKRQRIDLDRAGYIFWELSARRLLECLNRAARNNRVYWLTESGRRCQSRLRRAQGLPPVTPADAGLDWDLYGWLCYRHRAAIVIALSEPLHPATIKRIARRRDPALRMSANNARDAIRLLLRRGVVRKVRVPGEHHARYELTEKGHACRRLLLGAEAVA